MFVSPSPRFVNSVPPRPVPPSTPERSAAIRYWSACADYYQALGVSHFLAARPCPFTRTSFAAIHWHKGVAAANRFEALGGAA